MLLFDLHHISIYIEEKWLAIRINFHIVQSWLIILLKPALRNLFENFDERSFVIIALIFVINDKQRLKCIHVPRYNYRRNFVDIGIGELVNG